MDLNGKPHTTDASILLTVDVEDWFQVENLRAFSSRAQWPAMPLRVEESVRFLLQLFAEFKVRATFFVLGWIAERSPQLLREILAGGHEIASHGYNHYPCTELSTADLREDLRRSKALLEDVSGQEIFGFRAPNFSITESLVELLAELGFSWDSSYNDFALHDRYGRLPGVWQQLPQGCLLAANGLLELPVSNLHLGRSTIPWAGGAYFRLLPTWLFEAGVMRILRARQHYLFYCHPWEFDPGQPYISSISWGKRFRHYTNLHRSRGRLRHFLTTFQGQRFITCSAMAREIKARKLDQKQ